MEPSEIGIFLNKSWRPQLRDQTNASLRETVFFCTCNEGMGMMQYTDAELVECAAALRNLDAWNSLKWIP